MSFRAERAKLSAKKKTLPIPSRDRDALYPAIILLSIVAVDVL
jgi:hypothetical protein